MKYLNARIQTIGKSEIRKIFEAAGPDVVNLGLGEIQFPTPKTFLEYGKKVLDEGFISYTPNAGLPESRKAVSEYYNGVIPPENICLSVGGEEALFAVASVFIDSGDEVLIANPTFVAYESLIKMNNGTPVYFDLDPENDFKLNKEDIVSKINCNTKMMILCNPANPMSTSYNAEEADFLIDLCEKNDIILIADEMYRDLYLDEKPVSFAGRSKNIITVSGLTKSHCMSGWRIGWIAVTNPDFITNIIVAHQYICTCAPFLSQRILVPALSETGMKEVENIRLKLKANRDFAYDYLTKEIPYIKIAKSTSAPYLFFSIGKDDKELSMKFAESGVLVIPGSAFGSIGKNWIRLSFALDKDKLKKGLEIISYTLK
jgi:aspartate aminotransferase